MATAAQNICSGTKMITFSLRKVIIYDNIIERRDYVIGTWSKFAVQIFEDEERDMAEDEAVLKDVAGQLRAVRKSLGMTQEILAERVGTKKSNISRLESGRYNPSLEFLVKVAEGLGKKVQVKIGENHDKKTW